MTVWSSPVPSAPHRKLQTFAPHGKPALSARASYGTSHIGVGRGEGAGVGAKTGAAVGLPGMAVGSGVGFEVGRGEGEGVGSGVG